jgi:hypothetical protein
MRAQTISGVAAAAMALASTAALAQTDVPSSRQVDGRSAASHVYSQGMVVAQAGATIGDGSSPGYLKQQKKLMKEPGYNVGASTATVGDGSSPGYLQQQKRIVEEPGYSIGGSAAHVVDPPNPSNQQTQH